MPEKILITGGAGFIGSHLADELLEAGYGVRALDSLCEQVHGDCCVRPEYLSDEVELMRGDIRNPDAVSFSLEGIDAVVHFAASVGVGQSMCQVKDYTEVNDYGTAVLLQALVENPVRRLVVPGPGAEVEASRGCPFSCSFCAKDAFRGSYRRRPTSVVIQEIDGLLDRGTAYIYFIDEIFQPRRRLLESLAQRPVCFGVQLRIDLWSKENLELLGKAGCVSIEAGVEATSFAGRKRIDKMLRVSIAEVEERLRAAKSCIPFVQANLVRVPEDNPSEVLAWRDRLRDFGVWANDPVPIFPYPGSPEYLQRFGPPGEDAYLKASRAYLSENKEFCDLQDQHPVDLSELETK